jgi:hypothetical protein
MSEERFEQDSQDETDDVEAHKKSTQARHVDAKDEPGDESDEVEAHAKKV